MPYTNTEPSLPFVAGSNTSYQAAMEAVPGSARKVDRLRALYLQFGPLSDPEVEALTQWPRSSICSTRNHLKDELVREGVSKSKYGKNCDRWRLA